MEKSTKIRNGGTEVKKGDSGMKVTPQKPRKYW